MKEDGNTNREINIDESENTRESIVSSNIEEDNMDHQQQVLYLDQVHLDKSVQTTSVPLRMNQSSANTAIACPPPPNLW